MKLPPFYPKAEWRPSPNYYAPAVFTLKATVGHSAHSPLHAEPPPRFFTTNPPPGQERGSTHNWVMGNGRFIQMVRYDCGAFGNGALNRDDGASSRFALVRDWYRTRRNPNYDTISTEFPGYGVSAPAGQQFTPITDDQWDSWFQFLDWCASEGVEFDENNTLVHSDISNTACPDGRFINADMLRKVRDEVTKEEYGALVVRIAELERRTGASPPNEQRARNADLLLYADGLNSAIWRNINAIDDLRSIVADLSPSSTVAVADALELAADKLRGIDRHVDGTGEGK